VFLPRILIGLCINPSFRYRALKPNFYTSADFTTTLQTTTATHGSKTPQAEEKPLLTWRLSITATA